MEIAVILRVSVVVAGILLLCLDFASFVHRKITESIGLGWAFFSLILILIGSLPGLSAWSIGLEGNSCIVVFLMGFFMIFGVFFLSRSISQLIRKNQELAMQVSLLNQENERILSELEELKGYRSLYR